MVSHVKDLEVRLGKDTFLKSLLSYEKGDDDFSQSYKLRDDNRETSSELSEYMVDTLLGCRGFDKCGQVCGTGNCQSCTRCGPSENIEYMKDAFLGCKGSCTSPGSSCSGGKGGSCQYASSKNTHEGTKDKKVPSILIPESVLDILSGV